MPAYVLLTRDAHARSVTLTSLDSAAAPGDVRVVDVGALTDVVAQVEAEHHPRWVWDDTRRWYPPLLDAGVRVERCHDLRLCHTILRHAASAAFGLGREVPQLSADAGKCSGDVEPAGFRSDVGVERRGR